MKRSALALLVCSLLATPVFAEEAVTCTAAEAKDHLGKEVTVKDTVMDVYKAKGGNTFLNFGGKHPNETFVAFIPVTAAEKFPEAAKMKGSVVSVTGKVTEHKGKPQITVMSPEQIKVETPAAEPEASPTTTP